MSMMADNDAGVAGAAGAADEQLKKRARRRLVGAIALVLFAVIVLPMVMDHEPRPSGPEIQVRIPSQDGPAAKPVPLKAANPAAEPSPKPEVSAAPTPKPKQRLANPSQNLP
jgi:DedD protein